jgi:hypothetical protein
MNMFPWRVQNGCTIAAIGVVGEKSPPGANMESGVFLCNICGKAVSLEISKIDEYGQPVHEGCYVADLLSKIDKLPSEKKSIQ